MAAIELLPWEQRRLGQDIVEPKAWKFDGGARREPVVDPNWNNRVVRRSAGERACTAARGSSHPTWPGSGSTAIPASNRGWCSEYRIKPSTVDEALKADVVFLAVPFNAVSQAVGAAGSWQGRIVVDATNALEYPSFKPLDLNDRLSSHVVADAVPGASVVKAFNTLPAALLASDPRKDGGRRVLFVSGDQPKSNVTVAALIEELGFSPIVLGPIDEGGRLQQFGGPLMVHNLSRHA